MGLKYGQNGKVQRGRVIVFSDVFDVFLLGPLFLGSFVCPLPTFIQRCDIGNIGFSLARTCRGFELGRFVKEGSGSKPPSVLVGVLYGNFRIEESTGCFYT